MAENKDAKNWVRDVVMFTAGMGTGATLTALAGHLTNGKVPVPAGMQQALTGAVNAVKK